MALPASGALGMAQIANTDGANSIGVVTPYSLYQLNVLAGKEYDYGSKISNFYSYPGYGYKYASPDILHDFGLSTRFPTSSSSIIDTSGNGRTGTFVTGTGNGTSANVTGYTTTFPGMLATSASGQYSVRLNDVAKYGGTSQFTWVVWFRCTGFTSSYNGLISCEGRSGSTPIGQSMYISNASGTFVRYERWDSTTGNATSATVQFGGGSMPSFVSGKWYMASVAFFGGGGILSVFVDGSQYTSVFSTTSSVTTSTSWSCFAGLRYNNWLDGNLGYVATYSTAYNNNEMIFFNQRTRKRYE